uniref:Uncharacterized protein n=3 Tax=Aegilops tauschii subsp. strangulata TaxID=200361 RepID=A0A453C2E1_AEGTS
INTSSLPRTLPRVATATRIPSASASLADALAESSSGSSAGSAPLSSPKAKAGGDGNGRSVLWYAARDEGLKAPLRWEKKARKPTPGEHLLDPAELERLRRARWGTGRCGPSRPG